jgi:UDP-N-acetylmuramoyl-L-alanyl-D-glutamate--2,6-diaminopimelate ligase
LHLSNLFGDLIDIPMSVGNLEVNGIAVDSRHIIAGDVFFAISGSAHDGRDFIEAAIGLGVSAIVTDDRPISPKQIEAAAAKKVVLLQCKNPRKVMAHVAARFWPSQPGMIAAVTGTNGKTSTAVFLSQLWRRATWQSVTFGTLGVTGASTLKIKGVLPDLPALTTPDCLSLHMVVNRIAEAGVTHLALEASSHGLEQYRLDGLNIHVAAFTNLSRDHLDHHNDMDSYFAAKKRLFTELLRPGGCAVVNLDDPYSAEIINSLKCREIVVKTYGFSKDAHFRVDAITPVGEGLNMQVVYQGQHWQIPLAMSGTFQAMNALGAAVMAYASGLTLHDSLGGLPYLSAVPGRMQPVHGHPRGARILVDYAHTPDALAVVLGALRLEAKGKLVAVFGCGGDRDPGKRQLMGAVAATGADRVIVTDDNPRSEDPASIRAAIMAACPKSEEVTPRDKAITKAINDLNSDDILLIAGKGHESVQLIGTETLPFSDATVASNAIHAMRETKQ